MRRPVFIPIFVFLFFLYFSSKIFAEGEFKTDYQSSYVIDENGATRVTQDVTITNLTSQYYVSNYEFTIGSEVPTNITAWDSTGPLKPIITKGDGKTKISLQFEAKVVGTGNQLAFGIAYDFPGLANHNGLLWDLNLLRLSGLETISSYDLTISVPNSFGPLLFSFPNPKTQTQESGKRVLTFDKQALLQGAPRMGFGNLQLYKVSLTYHLRNPSLGLGYTEIALPPDIAGYQKIIQTSFLPSPNSIRVDDDGNYLARYNLGPFEEKKIVWEGLIALFYPPRSLGEEKAAAIPAELVQKYTQSQKYWEKNAVEIQAQAAKLTDPAASVTKNLRQIYDFVVGYLSYDYQELASGNLVRQGALAALAQKDKAVCMEYTDLFIALARAAGIPAREINGYAYTADTTNRPLSLKLAQGDVLHAWPEAYFPGTGWIMVDPTWGSTSGSNYFSAFDLSHVAFVIQGVDSQYPLPAGSYKTNPNQKDVDVSFSNETKSIKERPKLELAVNFGPLAISPFSTQATILVTNPSRVSAFGAVVSITDRFLKPSETVINLGTIPAGATIQKTIQLMPANAATGGTENLTANVTASDFDGEKIEATGSNRLPVYPLYLPAGILTLLAAGVILGRRFLPK